MIDLAALLEQVPEDVRESLRSLVVALIRRYALAEVNGLALLADLEELKEVLGIWITAPLASPEPSQSGPEYHRGG